MKFIMHTVLRFIDDFTVAKTMAERSLQDALALTSTDSDYQRKMAKVSCHL
jgi:hypothetical protein